MSFFKKVESAKQLIENYQNSTNDRDLRTKHTLQLATYMLDAANATISDRDFRMMQHRLSLMNDYTTRYMMHQIVDQMYRSANAKRTVNQIVYLIDYWGIPKSLSWFDRLNLWLFMNFASFMPTLFLYFLNHSLDHEFSTVIIPDGKALRQHLKLRQQEGYELTINHLGEVVLGEKEADRRLQLYMTVLGHESVNQISVKISSIYSQINLLDWDHTISVVCQRFSKLVHTALQYPDPKTKQPKMVMLDMESFKDLEITVQMFKLTMDKPEFKHANIGIALQSYIPDSYAVLESLIEWAHKRVQLGGSKIKIRLVKGANISLERIDASLNQFQSQHFHLKQKWMQCSKRCLNYWCKRMHLMRFG